MNLSPLWVQTFAAANIEAVHWSTIGQPIASDRTLFEWAQANDHIIFTNDLDFSAILAATQASTPSVIQIRGQDVLPSSIGTMLINSLKQFETELKQGALISIDPNRARARILPLKRPQP